MNSEQIKRIVTWALTSLGGILVGWAASRGHQWGSIANQILTSEWLVGLLVMVATGVFTYLSAKVPWLVAIIDALAKDPNTPVAGVIMTPTKAGAEIAQSLPGNETVVAGTPAAASIAKAV